MARQSIDQAELRTMLTEEFDRQSPPDYVAANDQLYKSLGLIPADSNLRDLTLDMLTGGVVGFYRNDQGKLYVVSEDGLPGAIERITFAHEFDHALQDQNFSVFKDQDGVLDQSDRILARQAVYEGDSTLLMTLWASAHFSPQDMLAYVAASVDPAAQAVLARTPAFLRDLLLYPYTTGLSFVQATQLRDGWTGVDDLYRRMPVSTEQILHPQKYDTNEAPIPVTLPVDLAEQLGSGWSVPLEDTFGELEIEYWLRESGVKPATATAAAAGWGGDRLAVAKGPSGAWGVVIDTAWDTAADASEFADAANTRDRRPGQPGADLVTGRHARHGPRRLERGGPAGPRRDLRRDRRLTGVATGYIDFGRGDPEQAQGVGQGDAGGGRERQARR